MAHGIVRTDKMFGTIVATGTASAKYLPSDVATEIDNGCFVVLGDYIIGEREVRKATTPAANSAAVALVASEEVDKTKKFDTLADFTNKAGSVLRCYVLHTGDEFSITADAFTKEDGVTPTVGTSILEAAASVKGSLVNTPTASTTKIADLIAIEQDGPVTWYVFRV